MLNPSAWPLELRAQTMPQPSGSSSRATSVDVYVVLTSAPVLAQLQAARTGLAKSEVRTLSQQRGAALLAEQAAIKSRLETRGARIIGHMTRLGNVLRVRVPANQITELAALPGVKRIVPARYYQRALSHSVPFIGAPSVWENRTPGIDGRAVRIGIIDTGIDYTHADFGGSGKVEDFDNNDPTRIETGTFPTAKVVGGFDFAGDDYDASDPMHSIPKPDPDPLDSKDDGHGTHVAGIAAGFGVLSNGLTYQGNYDSNLDMSQFAVAPGVAPRAELYALKVFGPTGSTWVVTEALEWASDPNGDYDFSDHLDVVNLSLGSMFGTQNPEDPEILAVNLLAQLGCIVVCAAGNDGNVFYAAGTPGSASRALAVGNSIDKAEGEAIQVLSPPLIAGNYFALEGDFTARLTNSGPITGQIAYIEPHEACDPITNASEIKGRIALVDRGTCFFVDKIQQAQDAGAIAVIMVNNQDGDPIAMGGSSSTITIPGVMISKLDGALLKTHLHDNPTVRLDPDLRVVRPQRRDTLSEDSSRGPVGLVDYLKPEIVAPGSEIVSAAAGTGTQGRRMNGTSMASPHIAGAAALLRQMHPDWSVEDIKAALMNTALTTHDEQGNFYPESRIGAGRVQLDLAATLEVTAAAANAEGNVALSFGSLVIAEPFQTNRTIRLANHGDSDVTLDIQVVATQPQTGVSLTPSTRSVTVPAHSSAEASFAFVADPEQFDLAYDATTPLTVSSEPRHALFEASGQIYFEQDNLSLHVPYYANVRGGSAFKATSNLITVAPKQNTKSEVDLSIRFQGSSSIDAPVVSVFELGTTQPDNHLLSPYNADATLLAVGAASDFAYAGSLSNAFVYFGLATANSWPAPQPRYVELCVLIDTNFDGTTDFILCNDNLARTNTTPATADVFMTAVHFLDAEGDSEIIEFGGYLNVFSADGLDSAPFNNSVMILSAWASQIGLADDQSRFNYRVVTYGFSTWVSSTSWITFDAAHPIIDATYSGFEGTPLHPDGDSIQVHVDRAAAATQRQRMPAVMLLHHHNLTPQRLEVVRLDLSQDDLDNDRLPDWWEVSNWNNLASASRETDSDQDGSTDYAEFMAGTDPVRSSSSFRLLSAKPQTDGGIKLSWNSAPGRFYSVFSTTNLPAGTWMQITTNQPATPPQNSFIDTNLTDQQSVYYRIRLE